MAKNSANASLLVIIISLVLTFLIVKIWREISMASDLVYVFQTRCKNEHILESVVEIALPNLKTQFRATLKKLKMSKNLTLDLDFSYLIPILNSLNLLSHWHDLKSRKIILSYYLPTTKEENSRKILLFNVILYDIKRELLKLRYIAILNKQSDVKVRKLYEI